MTVTVAAAWILTACVIGVATDASSSVGAAVLLVAFGLAPPLLVLRGWREPPQMLSESIQHQQALR